MKLFVFEGEEKRRRKKRKIFGIQKYFFAEEKKKVWSGLEKCITSVCDHFGAVNNHFPAY